ncbi:polyphenol oxidase family protein [Leptospira kanakyensis]|uniref:polyphenol oxidase family protein n=1 Tax=Leptospira kanakyensis TaxID=2484968 RepID=UPI00223D9D98|nr:polyphenol oxidase family protein [Leptospira kanakyensis]MCW7467963.1 polyphenol oxidase family protein [Leptospira kanakyensis]
MEYTREIIVPYGKIKFGTAGKQSLDGIREVDSIYPKTAELWKQYTEVWVQREFKTSKPIITTLNQVHGDSLHSVTSQQSRLSADRILEGDGLYTEIPKTMLVVRTADCVPVFLYSNKQQFVAMIHSGWKGTSLGITEKMIDTAIRLGYTQEELHLEIGPYIQGSDYEVESDVANLFSQFGETVLFTKGQGKFLLDVGLAIEKRVREKFSKMGGVKNSHINVYRSPLYFSHRAKEEGRNLNFILWES